MSNSSPNFSGNSAVDLAVVVVSSDGYSDFWPIFFACWNKYSPFPGLPVYLLAASKSFSAEGVRVVNTPHLAQASWSERIKAGLTCVNHEYVLMLTEDLLCIDYSDTRFSQGIYRFIDDRRPTCLRLIPSPPPQGEKVAESIAVIPPWAMHRVALQASVWNREKLLQLFKPGETPAGFEVSATRRCRSDLEFFSVDNRAFPLLEVIGRGRITRRGARLIRRLGLAAHIQREVFTMREECAREWGHLKAAFFYWLPAVVQRWLLSSGIVGAAFK